MGQPGQSEKLAPPLLRKALQYFDSNRFIELTVVTSRVLMSKAVTNNICSKNINTKNISE
jgi:hypothetical protein